MLSPDQLTLAVLAGGRATRLGGRDKGQLICEGRTLLDRLMDLRVLCCDVLVVKEDLIPGKGAPGGLVTALCAARTPFVLAVACDMPRVSLGAALALCEVGALACFEVEGRLEPFPGLYPSTLGEAWRARLTENPALKALLAEGAPRKLDLFSVDSTGATVRSVNTPQDAAELGVDIP